ncbi:uncharacterized protein TNCV_2035981 [Trichonephila clavipes]|nr:uncharacterized protein TNCV_2035981 [Trichonephila clavipes]
MKKDINRYVIPPNLCAKFTPSDHMLSVWWSTTAEFSNRHYSCRAVSSSIRVAGGGNREDTAWPRASQRFSMVLRSSEYVGHAIRAIPSLPGSHRRCQLYVDVRYRPLKQN